MQLKPLVLFVVELSFQVTSAFDEKITQYLKRAFVYIWFNVVKTVIFALFDQT